MVAVLLCTLIVDAEVEINPLTLLLLGAGEHNLRSTGIIFHEVKLASS